MATPPYPLQPEPIKKSWLERNPLWKIPLGCLTLFVLLAAFVIGLMTVITSSFRHSDVYQQAIAQATANLQVRERIGEPIKPGWLISGEMNMSSGSGKSESDHSNIGPARPRKNPCSCPKERWGVAVHVSAGGRGKPVHQHRPALHSASRGAGFLMKTRKPAI
jgi:hypothetical protein